MKINLRYTAIALALIATAAFTAVLRPSAAQANDAELKAILDRAAEIAPMLDGPESYGASAKPREYWSKFANGASAKRAIANGEQVLKSDPPTITEELYKEYYKNGNRSNYQSAFGREQKRVVQLALAEQFENQGRFVDALNKELIRFCDLPSWVLPAHDRDARIYDGKAIYSDLGSTLAAADVAVAVNLLQDKLDPKVVERAKEEIERRVLRPYEASVGNVYGANVAKAVELIQQKLDQKLLESAMAQIERLGKKNVESAVANAYDGMWWVRTTNNWNAVCHAGTVVAALNIVDSPERRAFFLAGAEYFSENNFLKGFTNDGYCSEGMGYWNYGFGYYMYLGAAARVATHGQLDFFRFPKIHAVLDFAPTLVIDGDLYAVFADCSATARPDPVYVGYLSRLNGYGYTEFESAAFGGGLGANDLMQTTTIGFDEEIAFPSSAAEPQKYNPPIRTEFSDAGVVICRPSESASGKYFAIAFKGGHNGEMHNHNDVGSYSLVLGDAAASKKSGVYVSRDPGGETYTARTFSSRRYEGELLNSFGHPVPRIAGTLQSAGGKYKGVVVEKTFTDAEDVVVFDITSAYPEAKTLDKALRTFRYRRAQGNDPGDVTITDAIALKAGETGSIETALVSFEKEIGIEQTADGGLEVKLAGAVVKVSAADAEGKPLKLVAEKAIVGETDPSVPNKPTRVALRVDGDVNSATIVQKFEVLQ